jgi:hypothetical protein
MPVEDHPVHELTRLADDAKYGCHSVQERSTGYYVRVRDYRPDGTYVTINRFVPDRGSRECRYDFSQTDRRCSECSRQTKTAT